MLSVHDESSSILGGFSFKQSPALFVLYNTWGSSPRSGRWLSASLAVVLAGRDVSWLYPGGLFSEQHETSSFPVQRLVSVRFVLQQLMEYICSKLLKLKQKNKCTSRQRLIRKYNFAKVKRCKNDIYDGDDEDTASPFRKTSGFLVVKLPCEKITGKPEGR